METYILTYKTFELSPSYCTYDRFDGTNDYEYATYTILATDYKDAKTKAFNFLDNEASYWGRAKFVALNWVKPKKAV